MGVTEDYLRMMVEVRGAALLPELEQKLVNVGKESANLGALFRAQAISEEMLEKETRRLAEAKSLLNNQINQLKGGTAAYQQNLTGLSYAMNDFFSNNGDLGQKLNGIANNMPMLMAGFGGLGLALSAVIPIIAMVIQNWDHLKEAFGGTTDTAIGHIDRLKAHIEELNKEKIKPAVDLLELREAEKELAAFKADMARATKETRSADEKEAGGRVSETLAEAPGGEAEIIAAIKTNIVKKLLPGALADTHNEISKIDESIKEVRAKPVFSEEDMNARKNEVAELEKQRKKLEGDAAIIRLNVDSQALATAGKFIGGAEKGYAHDRESLAKELDESGKGALAESIRAAGPGTVAKEERDDREFDRGIEAMKAAGKRRREKEAAAKKDEDAADAIREKTNVEIRRQTKEREDAKKAKEHDEAEGASITGMAETEIRRMQHQDESDITSKLDDEFIGKAQLGRAAVADQPAAVQKAFQEQLKQAAKAQLIRNGLDPAHATRLANEAVPGFVDKDIQRQLDSIKALGGPEDVGGRMGMLQNMLRANLGPDDGMFPGLAEGFPGAVPMRAPAPKKPAGKRPAPKKAAPKKPAPKKPLKPPVRFKRKSSSPPAGGGFRSVPATDPRAKGGGPPTAPGASGLGNTTGLADASATSAAAARASVAALNTMAQFSAEQAQLRAAIAQVMAQMSALGNGSMARRQTFLPRGM